MSNIVLLYIPCTDEKQAKAIGMQLLKERLAACINIIPSMHSVYFWPPKSATFESANETVLLVKTSRTHVAHIEKRVTELHTYRCPCIMAIPVASVNKQYEDWLLGELA